MDEHGVLIDRKGGYYCSHLGKLRQTRVLTHLRAMQS
jgi:hypothetical protein